MEMSLFFKAYVDFGINSNNNTREILVSTEEFPHAQNLFDRDFHASIDHINITATTSGTSNFAVHWEIARPGVKMS